MPCNRVSYVVVEGTVVLHLVPDLIDIVWFCSEMTAFVVLTELYLGHTY